jgi:hypothetical protein
MAVETSVKLKNEEKDDGARNAQSKAGYIQECGTPLAEERSKTGDQIVFYHMSVDAIAAPFVL